MSLDSVLKIVREDRPVIVWVSMNMSLPYVSTSWIYKPTGEKIKWLSNEHALVVIGYNQNQVIVSDSLNGQVRYYDRYVFEASAIAITPPTLFIPSLVNNLPSASKIDNPF